MNTSPTGTPTATGILNVSLPPEYRWAIEGNALVVRLDSIHGRMAARALAYSLASAGDDALAKAILDRVGREG